SLRPTLSHDEGWLFYRVVPDGDDEIGSLDGFMHVVTFGKCRRAHVEFRAARNGALTHLRSEVWDSRPQYELGQIRRRARPGSGCTQHHERCPGGHDHFGCATDRSSVRQWQL